MAIRTTSAAVSAIIEVDVTISLDPFIEIAEALVTELLEPATQADGTTLYYGATRLELIERWLAAHFYAIRDQRNDTEKAGPVMEKKQYEVGLGLDQTIYGQQVKVLDTSGILAGLDQAAKTGKTRVGSVSWLGTAPTTNNYVY